MPTCEEWAAQRLALQQALIVDAVAEQAAVNVRMTHQTQLWYVEYNLALQCGGGEGSGSGFARGQGFELIPPRRPDELQFIMQFPELAKLHRECEERGLIAG